MKAAPAEALYPGWPGRGLDPTGTFSDMQWYMYHQRNVAYFAAFAAEDFTVETYVPLLRAALAAAPHMALAYGRSGATVDDDLLRRLVSVESVAEFDGFPDCWLGDGLEVFGDPGLPLVRVRIARRAGGADALGRRSFVVARVAHALTEGEDSALLTRSQRASHDSVRAGRPTPWPLVLAGRAAGVLAALGHLAVSRVWTPHPGPIRIATRAYPRAFMGQLARHLGVSQRAFYMALSAHVIVGAALPGSKRRLSCTYSTLRAGGGSNRDQFIRMRMLFARFANHDRFAALAGDIEAGIAAEDAEGGFGTELGAGAIGFHRWFSGVMPFLYRPRVFAFLPYDFVFALLPPHHLEGPVTAGMIEPVYAGATLAGANGCVVVPGRRWVTLAFALEEDKLGQMGRLDALVAGLAAEAGVREDAEVRHSGHD